MSWLSKGLKSAEHFVAKIPHTTAKEKRDAMQAAQEQISYYKTAKEDLIKTRNEADAEKKNEASKINSAKIKARQRLYKRGGFLEAPTTQPKETLG